MDIVLLVENLVRGDNMASLKCVGSGSSGNCYILTCNNEKLILDCGLPIKVIKQGLDFDLQGIQAILVGHKHLDHSLSANDFKKMGFEVWRPYIEYAEYTSPRIYHKVFGKFSVKCFPLPHNGTDNFGFLIECEGQKILYMTDFEYCPYVFTKQKINHILIECNYQQELVDRDLPNYEHKIRGHCSLDTCKEFIKVNATDSLQTVILCHLGQETTEPEECVAEIQKVANKANVCVAERGVEIELRKKGECPF